MCEIKSNNYNSYRNRNKHHKCSIAFYFGQMIAHYYYEMFKEYR